MINIIIKYKNNNNNIKADIMATIQNKYQNWD